MFKKTKEELMTYKYLAWSRGDFKFVPQNQIELDQAWNRLKIFCKENNKREAYESEPSSSLGAERIYSNELAMQAANTYRDNAIKHISISKITPEGQSSDSSIILSRWDSGSITVEVDGKPQEVKEMFESLGRNLKAYELNRELCATLAAKNQNLVKEKKLKI